jgi:hypothetical protein
MIRENIRSLLSSRPALLCCHVAKAAPILRRVLRFVSYLTNSPVAKAGSIACRTSHLVPAIARNFMKTILGGE